MATTQTAARTQDTRFVLACIALGSLLGALTAALRR
jgi:hypothetical protein